MKRLKLDHFLRAENECTKQTINHFQKDLALYERSLNLLLDMIAHLSKRSKSKHFSRQKSIVISIMPRIIQSLQSIRDLTLRGYYYDSAIVERGLVESLGLCAYLAQNKEEADKWISEKHLSIAVINYSDYIGKLFKSSKKATDSTKALYGQLSDYVHTNPRAVISLLYPNHSLSALRLILVPEFNEKRVQADIISNWSTLALTVLSEIFDNELAKSKRDKILKHVASYLNYSGDLLKARS